MKTIAIFCKICGTRLTQPLLHLDNPRDINWRLDGYDLVPPGMFIYGHDVEQAWGTEERKLTGGRKIAGKYMILGEEKFRSEHFTSAFRQGLEEHAAVIGGEDTVVEDDDDTVIVAAAD